MSLHARLSLSLVTVLYFYTGSSSAPVFTHRRLGYGLYLYFLVLTLKNDKHVVNIPCFQANLSINVCLLPPLRSMKKTSTDTPPLGSTSEDEHNFDRRLCAASLREEIATLDASPASIV